jgi:uncharacterized DUF497 family protein
MSLLDRLRECTGFQWDEGNAEKNWLKHGVTRAECEHVFFNQPLVVVEDAEHSGDEERVYALGHSHAGRLLFIVCTVRGQEIRVISARDMSANERKVYRSS